MAPLSLPFLIFLLFSSISHSSSTNFQFLDVSASQELTQQVFSTPKNQELLHSSQDSSSPFTLTLYPRSSLFPHTDTNYTSLSLARLARDSIRVNSLFSSLQTQKPENLEAPITSGLSLGSGEYFARLGVGQPVKQSYLVIDTGSDITWLQCEPCTHCYKQSEPIFNPASSSTYKPLQCSSQQCAALHIYECNQQRSCLYQVSYGDGSNTSGVFSIETVSFDSGSVPDVAIGCGHDNKGLHEVYDGILGLSEGALSFPSQNKANSFSYCLVNRDNTSAVSTLEFNSTLPSDSILTPILKNSRFNRYFYVGLAGFIVDGNEIDIPASLFAIASDGSGGVILDSGTTVTMLRPEAYNALRDAFVSMSKDLRPSSGVSLYDTCFDLSGLKMVKVPTLALKFAGGETLLLPPKNYIIPVDPNGKYCFAFVPAKGSLPMIIGSVQQQGIRVSYNLASRTVGFSPNKC